LEDTLIITTALTTSPPPEDRYYCDKIFPKGIASYVVVKLPIDAASLQLKQQ